MLFAKAIQKQQGIIEELSKKIKIKNGLTLYKTIKTLYLNMKYIFMPFLFLLSFSVSAQTVISSAGKTTINGNYNVSWTVGETVINTLSAGGTILTQGFHQPLLIEILPTGIEKELLLDMIAYPNPAFDKVLFKGGDPSGIYHIRVVDKLGRILLQKTLPASDLEILVEGYNNGTYLIEVVEDKTNKRRVVKRKIFTRHN